jgi:leucyl aminopeptidase
MELKISLIDKPMQEKNLLVMVSSIKELAGMGLTKDEIEHVKQSLKEKIRFISINQYKRWFLIQVIPEKKNGNELLEALRREGSKTKAFFNKNLVEEITIVAPNQTEDSVIAYIEGMALSHYTFLKYFSEKKEKENKLKKISVFHHGMRKEKIEELQTVVQSVSFARDLVNEPLSFLDTKQLCDELKKAAKDAGVSIEILGKKQIQSLKMGGLLAVNKGSSKDPAFIVLNWKPDNAKNKKPLILVGKGIVYDTGGLSLKPTPDSMDYMKCDMAGAAAVAAAIIAVAKLKLPVHVLAIIPATDNAIGNNAYVPGDVINMHNKKTVEVLNTDAEGRLILADALSYAIKYKPGMVIDVATLTGAAAMAFGHYAMAIMGNAPDKLFKQLETSSQKTGERMVRVPLYDDFAELIKSDIADIKNIGGRIAGMITPGKFLEFFTDYPWAHMDIAGPAWVNKESDYYTKGGTGFPVRLLVDFAKNYKEV